MTRYPLAIILGLSQLICWGISYYLIGAFGELIAADLGWSLAVVHGGFSAALLVMALASPLTGRLIDRHGGRMPLAAGSVLMAAACLVIAAAGSPVVYYTGWILLGVAMRLALTDSVFAALAQTAGSDARRQMTIVTLIAGLSSSVLWPVGHFLGEQLGWRGGLMVYAGLALLTVPCHLALPPGGIAAAPASGTAGPEALVADRRALWLAGCLYALMVTMVTVLTAGLTAHLIGILTGLGLAAASAVWVAAMVGLGQATARLADLLSGSRLHPLDLNLLAAAAMPPSLAALLWGAGQPALAAILIFAFGASNGIVWVTRGTLPLVLFDRRSYGLLTGRLLVPGFLFAAAGPLLFALVIERFGEPGAVLLATGLALVSLAAATWLKLAFGRRQPLAPPVRNGG